MAVKDFIDEALTKGHCSAGQPRCQRRLRCSVGPSILKALKDFSVPEIYTTLLGTTLVTGRPLSQQRVRE